MSCRSWHAAAFAAGLTAFWTACSNAPHRGADAGEEEGDAAADAGGNSDADAGEPVLADCPTALVPPCDDAIYELPLVVAADVIGDGFEFVDATPDVLLAQRETSGDTEIAAIRRLPDDIFSDESLVAILDVGDRHLVGGSEPGENDAIDGSTTLALVCAADGACDVYLEFSFPEADAWGLGNAFEQSPRWHLPAELAARAIRPLRFGIAAVVGNGAVELLANGELQGLVVPDAERPLNDISADGLAVGAGGRVAWNGSGDAWASSEVDAGTSIGLLSAAAVSSDGTVAIAGADGLLGSGRPDDGFAWTPLADEPLLAVRGLLEEYSTLHVLTASGCALQNELGDFCVEGVVPGAATRILIWECWGWRNASFLAPSGLYGDSACYDYE